MIDSLNPTENRVLILVYAFPPIGGVGVMRSLSFARYLPQNGCKIWVVTARNARTAYYDPSLLKQVPAGVEVHRTFTPELPYAWRTWLWKRLRGSGVGAKAPQGAAPAGPEGGNPLQRLVRWLATPDPQRVWLPWALARTTRLVRQHQIDTVVISVPPFSELLLAAELKRRIPSLRLILDFRDEWLDFTISHIESASGDKKRTAVAGLERQAIEAADLVLSVTEAWRARTRGRYPDQASGKFQCLPNGYDDETFRGFQPRPHAGNKLVLTYLGTVYARSVYSPQLFLEALDGLDASVRSELELRFVGRVEPEIEPLLQDRGYEIVRHGFVPHREGVRLLEETDALLLFANDPTWQPAKIFEYVATRKPILAITPPEGEAAGLIRETGTGYALSPNDPESIRTAVRELVEQHRRALPWNLKPVESAIAGYSRSALAARLASLIRALPT